MNTRRLKLNLILPFGHSFSLPKKKVLFSFFWGLFLIVSLLLIFYLFQITKLTEASYLIKIYNQKIEILTKESFLLENQYNQLVRLDELEKSIEPLNLVKISETKYLFLSPDQLVQEGGKK